MHQNHEYKVHSMTSACSVSRQKSKNECRCSVDVMKVKINRYPIIWTCDFLVNHAVLVL